jgi:hypothetical protein
VTLSPEAGRPNFKEHVADSPSADSPSADSPYSGTRSPPTHLSLIRPVRTRQCTIATLGDLPAVGSPKRGLTVAYSPIIDYPCYRPNAA